MRRYGKKITLAKNARGVWDLDTIKGCKSGMAMNSKGCYGACYSYRMAHRFYDFANPTVRGFENEKHRQQIVKKVKAIDTGFVRMGVMGDPSECWEHTIDVCEKIQEAGKTIVIVTKHWEPMSESLYDRVARLGLVVNTSVSALDGGLLAHRLGEYEKLKAICTSVLRVVSCDFILSNVRGRELDIIQQSLFDNENVIDTMLRIPKNHPLVAAGVVRVKRRQFLTGEASVSERNPGTHFGRCDSCPDKCGTTMSKEAK
jgi:hypothetical protein